ncbi:MAG TPA: caspase family protein [Oscillatoriales cyanobacterium M59_W2019_021]|nr:caspase family protein [Oscillatoriales cyanobacterium M4454_W2019_049]HIK49464.1 caspase family protein [Oscillatoriales cyanobacterium M59_W2019_021]
MKRRGFLQRAGSLLAALGLSETGLWWLAEGARSALAQPAGRKLALLVGIDQYPETIYGSGNLPLTGCATDVRLLREVLVHRFGFQPDDILTLTDDRATRSQIETAWVEHLQNRAKADDVVVFHFSGYGSRAKLSDSADSWQNTLIPVDGGASEGEAGTVNDLPLETLWLLLRSLPTDRVLTVLDTSYFYPDRSLQGNFRIRSLPQSAPRILGSSAREFQDRWRRDSGLLGRFVDLRKIPGVVLGAASPEGWALEAQWQGFSAGLLTYALTQQLWQMTDKTSIPIVGQSAAGRVKQWTGNAQHPQLCRGMELPCPQKEQGNPPGISPGLLAPAVGEADGAVLAIDEGGTARIWLAGLPPEIVESYGANAVLTTVPTPNSDAPPATRLQVRVREGLTVKAQAMESSGSATLQTGQPVWESVRVLPRHPSLTVALDGTLERIERVDATSAFATLRRVSPVTVGEQPADCLFGRVRQPQSIVLEEGSPQSSRGTYGLLSPAGEPIPGSLTDTEEAVKTAVGRLSPQLEKLRALKLLRSIANEGSSQLGMKASLVVVGPEDRISIEKQTARGVGNLEKPTLTFRETNGILTLPALSRIRYRVKNLSDRPLYFTIFSFDPDGRTPIYYPLTPDAQRQQRPIPPGEMAIVPVPSQSEGWLLPRTPGLVTTQIVGSTRPFSATLAALETAKVPKSNDPEVVANPLEIASAIVEDLHQASLPATQDLELAKEMFALDVRNWATLNFAYEVV